jgi:hypothetical protein
MSHVRLTRNIPATCRHAQHFSCWALVVDAGAASSVAARAARRQAVDGVRGGSPAFCPRYGSTVTIRRARPLLAIEKAHAPPLSIRKVASLVAVAPAARHQCARRRSAVAGGMPHRHDATGAERLEPPSTRSPSNTITSPPCPSSGSKNRRHSANSERLYTPRGGGRRSGSRISLSRSRGNSTS